MPDWPHAPPHRLDEKGVYMVTSGTYRKAHLLDRPTKLNAMQALLFSVTVEAGWSLHAWAILSNHYHFVASSPEDATTLRRALSKLHTLSARHLNACDECVGHKVWFQFFDSHITFTNSYLARLNYVHNNPVHHGIVGRAEEYRWCSAAWFARHARPSFRRTVLGFKTDTVRVADGFEPVKPMCA